jgi:hypothetical protein
MTYNFDPERWYENELAEIERRRRVGELDGSRYDAAVEDLNERYRGMLSRLDGTYRIPPSREAPESK